MEFWLSIRTLFYFFFFLLSIYWYFKHRHPIFKWGIIIAIVMTLNRTVAHYEYLLNPNPATKTFLSGVHLFISVLLLLSLSLIFYIFRDRRTTFKRDKRLKDKHRELNGFPELISIKPELKNFSEKEKYPYSLVIHLEIQNKDSKGLPRGKEEIRALDETEDYLDQKIRSLCSAYFIARTTYNGFRYLWYYTDSCVKLDEFFHSLNINTKEKMSYKGKRTFYTSFEKDPSWDKAQQYFVTKNWK